MAIPKAEDDILSIPTLTLGDRLMLARKKAGIGRDQMAALLGVRPSAVGHWETDIRKPKDVLETVRRWGEITHTPWSWLLAATDASSEENPFIPGQGPLLPPLYSLGQGVLSLGAA